MVARTGRTRLLIGGREMRAILTRPPRPKRPTRPQPLFHGHFLQGGLPANPPTNPPALSHCNDCLWAGRAGWAPKIRKSRVPQNRSVATICLKLPPPPSTNCLWRFGPRRMFRSAKYRAWLTEAGWELQAQRPGKVAAAYESPNDCPGHHARRHRQPAEGDQRLLGAPRRGRE
jgi:hypothetical protein